MQNGLSESALSRGWRDTTTALKSLWFWAVEIVGGAVIAAWTTNPWITVVFVVSVALALWMGATIAAPFKQRDEARRKLSENAEEAPGLDEPSVSFSEAAERLLLESSRLSDSLDKAVNSDAKRVWHCAVWVLTLARIGELTLLGREKGSPRFLPIDLKKTKHYRYSVDQSQPLRIHRRPLNGDKENPWGDDVRVYTSELNAVIKGFREGKMDEWSQNRAPDDEPPQSPE